MDSRMRGAGGGGVLFNGDGVSVLRDEKGLGMGSGDGCTALRVRLLLPNCPPEMVNMVNFILFFDTIF